MKYTIHVPDNFQHHDMLLNKVRQLGIAVEYLNLSKSFRIGGSDYAISEFLTFIKRFECAGVAALSGNTSKSRFVRSRIAGVRPHSAAAGSFTPIDIAKVYGLTASPSSRVGVAIIE